MKRVKLAILISIVLIAGIVFFILWINLQERDIQKEKEIFPKISNDGADAHLEKIHLIEEKQGQKTWELEAKSVQQYQDKNIMLVKDVRINYFSKEGRTFIISGKQGKLFQDSKNMELSGDVMIETSDGYRLKTHSIAYQHIEKKITTSDLVKIEGEQIQVVGKGMWIDMDSKIFKILSEVKTRWKGDKKG